MVIYERRHSPNGCVRIHDDCIVRTEAEREAVLREQQRAAMAALEILVDQLGVDGVEKLLAQNCPDSPLRESVQKIKSEFRLRDDGEWIAPVLVV